MWDFIAGPLGKLLLFIYNISFHNYGLAIIIFTLIIRLALMPLTFKQYQSTAKMQKLQPQLNEIQKRYKDDKEKLNQEMMKLYQENNYNPASGCLPMLIQLPIIMSLYWVIIQPLKFMLGKSPEAINKIVEVAASGLGKNLQQMGTQKELLAMNYFSEHQDKLSQVSQYFNKSELIDFNSFLGLHLGQTASYKPEILFGPEAAVYIPLFILVIIATVTTYISSKLAMPSTNNANSQNNAMGCTNNSMLLMGPAMTLMFSFTLPAGVILYWMAGYAVAIVQQLYVNKHILKKNQKPEQAGIEVKKAAGDRTAIEASSANKGKVAAETGESGDVKDTVTDGNESADQPAGSASNGDNVVGGGKQNTGQKKSGNKSGTVSSNSKYSGKNKKGGKKK